MSFSLYCPIVDEASDLSIDSLEVLLRDYFSAVHGFHIEREEDPFGGEGGNLLLSWDDWWIRVFYERGEDVLADSQEMANLANSIRREKICVSDRRVRVVFADDDDRFYTNHTIFMMDFLEARADLFVFDVSQRVFTN